MGTVEEVPFISHRMQRLQNERGVVMTLFWAQTAAGDHHLAVSGFDGRGSGHFLYSSTPEILAMCPAELQIPELKCTNRGEVMDWLDKIGAKPLSPHTVDPLPETNLLALPGGQPAEQVPKRRSKFSSGAGEVKSSKRRKSGPASFVGDTPDRPKAQTAGQSNGPGRTLLARPTAEALAAFESDSDLQTWIMESPTDATVEIFTNFAQQLSGQIKDTQDSPDSLPSRRQQLSSEQALEILDKIAAHGKASLQLLEASNISPCIGRLRRPPTPAAVAQKANEIAQLWHNTATATLTHAKSHMQNSVGS